MVRRPLVSIVMPVYNAMPYLEQAVQSIFAQTLSDWELITVDDCSTDSSWEYLQRIDDERVRIVRNDRNMKQAYTQNRGIDMARGKYIARMDADDMSMPQRLEMQIAALEAGVEIDVLGCGTYRIEENLNFVSVRRPVRTHKEITCLTPRNIQFFYGANFEITHGTMVGRSKWFKHWKCDRRVRFAQEFDLLCRAHRYSVLANISEPLYVYRGGVTESLSRQTLVVYCKAMSLIKNGFYKGHVIKTLVALASLVPRPAFYALKKVLGDRAGLTSRLGNNCHRGDKQILREGLAEISRVNVPVKGELNAEDDKKMRSKFDCQKLGLVDAV